MLWNRSIFKAYLTMIHFVDKWKSIISFVFIDFKCKVIYSLKRNCRWLRAFARLKQNCELPVLLLCRYNGLKDIVFFQSDWSRLEIKFIGDFQLRQMSDVVVHEYRNFTRYNVILDYSHKSKIIQFSSLPCRHMHLTSYMVAWKSSNDRVTRSKEN